MLREASKNRLWRSNTTDHQKRSDVQHTEARGRSQSMPKEYGDNSGQDSWCGIIPDQERSTHSQLEGGREVTS